MIIIADSDWSILALSLLLHKFKILSFYIKYFDTDIVTLAIKAGVRVPDGLNLTYPALSLDSNRYTPSLLKTL